MEILVSLFLSVPFMDVPVPLLQFTHTTSLCFRKNVLRRLFTGQSSTLSNYNNHNEVVCSTQRTFISLIKSFTHQRRYILWKQTQASGLNSPNSGNVKAEITSVNFFFVLLNRLPHHNAKDLGGIFIISPKIPQDFFLGGNGNRGVLFYHTTAIFRLDFLFACGNPDGLK